MMIAEATGVSRSSVHTIMTLLIPGALELSHSWHDMSDVKISNDELVGDNNCFHIIGTNENTDDTEAWIEKDSFLVRRIKERSVISVAQSEAMRAEAQTVESVAIMRASLEKAGLSAEMIETTLSSLATAFKPLTWQDIYEYSSISVNQPIDNNIFCELNRTSL